MHQDSSQSGWANAAGFFVLLVAVSAVVMSVLASCTDNPNADGSVLVIDDADLLSPQAESALREVQFPEDTPVILRTVGTIPEEKIGAFATDLMAADPRWQDLRPRGFLRRVFRQDLPEGPGVYFVASRNPQLLQIRFGRDIRIAAYQAGLAAGDWYRAHQEFTSDEQIVATVRELASEMGPIVDPWFLRRWAQWWGSLVTSEIEDFLAPSDGLYSDWLLSRFIALAHAVRATSSSWTFAAFIGLTFLAVWVLGKKLLVPRIKIKWIKTTLSAVSYVALIGVLIVGFASLALLSRGRIEDELALASLGLSFVSTVGFDSAMYSANGGFLLAIPAAITSFIGEFRTSQAIADEARRQGGEHAQLSFGWVAWGCALYLLPIAVGLPAMVVLIWDTVQSFRSEAPEQEQT